MQDINSSHSSRLQYLISPILQYLYSSTTHVYSDIRKELHSLEQFFDAVYLCLVEKIVFTFFYSTDDRSKVVVQEKNISSLFAHIRTAAHCNSYIQQAHLN